jgi:predicted transcriptional regulator
MKLSEIKEILNANVLCGTESLDEEVSSACGADLMSDVLAFVKDQSVLLTGLMNQQVVRTAEMMDMRCIVFVRGKTPDKSVIDLACQRGIAVMSTGHRLYEACGRLYSGGLV